MSTHHLPASGRKLFLYLILACLTLVAGNCKKDHGGGNGEDSEQGTDPLKPAAEIRTTIKGLVTDENGTPLSGVSVSVANETATTSSIGIFELDDIDVPGNRCLVLCEKQGYFEGSRAAPPVKNGVTQFRIVMMSKTVTKILNAVSGGKVSLSNGSEVQIPASGLVDGSGTAYTGSVNMSVRYLDPTKPDFGSLVPGGDMLAQRTDQRTSMLYSYGILRVKLTGIDGEDLQLATGKTSTIIMQIPDKQLQTAPATIPLWYFNEEKGIWIEEGTATKQGNKYIGTVKHFTDWNCDVPEESATIIGKLVDCKGDPAWGHVEFGEVGQDVGGSADTESCDGTFRQRVPAGIPLTVVVYDPLYLAPLLPEDQGKGKLIVLVPALSPGQVYNVGTLQIFPCLSSLKAKFKVKAGDEIDYVLFHSSSGVTRYISQPATEFTLNGFPINTNLIMTVKTNSGITLVKSIQTAAASGTVDIGEVDLTNVQEAYITGKLVCGTNPLTTGQVTASWAFSGGTRNEYDIPHADGTFRIAVELNKTIQVSMTTERGTLTRTITSSDKAGSLIDMGVIDFCNGPQPRENSFVINGDGFSNSLKVFNVKPYPQSTSIYITSSAITAISVFDASDTLTFTLYFSGKSTGAVPIDENTGLFIQRRSGNKTINYMAGFGFEGTSAEINVTRYDPVGGLVEGTFQGNFISDTQSKITITNGKFSVIRYMDL